MRKYLMKFDVGNTMADLSSTRNEAYRVQKKAKQQQCTFTDMWKK
jgi:hypothetical protein